MNVPRKIGRAYGFLKTGSSASRIKEAFARMKADPEVMVPKNLDLFVASNPLIPVHITLSTEVPSQLLGVSEDDDLNQLLQISERMGKKGANCLVHVWLPDTTNQETADELGHVLNLMYSCTEILGDAEVPVADIYFKNERGIYVSKLEANVY